MLFAYEYGAIESASWKVREVATMTEEEGLSCITSSAILSEVPLLILAVDTHHLGTTSGANLLIDARCNGQSGRHIHMPS